MWRLTDQLDRQLPDELTALPDVEVLIDPRHPATVRAPDVVITRDLRAAENPSRLVAADLLVAVEIVSPGTGRMDRVTKPAEYADAGIPHYWLIELDDPITLTAYTLVGDDYEIVARTSDTVALTEPAPITVDVRALTSRR